MQKNLLNRTIKTQLPEIPKYCTRVENKNMSSVSSFVAQNIGAGKYEHAKKSMYYAMATSLIFGIITFFVSFYHGNILAGIFSNDTKVIAACAEYMKAYSVDCILVCILFCFIGYFNGCEKTMFVIIQGILGAFLVRIPFSYCMSKMPGVTMLQIGFASPAATFFCIILCVIYFKNTQMKLKYSNDIQIQK